MVRCWCGSLQYCLQDEGGRIAWLTRRGVGEKEERRYKGRKEKLTARKPNKKNKMEPDENKKTERSVEVENGGGETAAGRKKRCGQGRDRNKRNDKGRWEGNG